MKLDRTHFFSSVGFRLTSVLVALMLVLISLLTILLVMNRSEELERSSKLELTAIGSVVQSSMSSYLQIERPDLVNGLISELKADPRSEFVGVARADCQLVFSYHSERIGQCLYDYLPKFDPAAIERVSASGVSEYLSFDNSRMLALLPISSLDGDVLDRERKVLVILQSFGSATDFIGAFFDDWLVLFVAVALVASGVWIYLNGYITRRVNRLTSAVSHLRAGNPIGELSLPGEDEISDLGDALEAFSRERLKAESKLRDAAQVFEGTIQGIMLTDKEGMIREVNQAFCDITGYSREEVVGKMPSILKSARQDPNFYSELWRSIRETGSWRGEIWNKRRSGEEFPELLTINVVKDEQGEVSGYAGVFSDISDIKASEQQIEYLTSRDPLTGLTNKTTFEESLERAVDQARKRQGKLAVAYIDIDRFKILNDSRGMELGDEILRLFAKRVSSVLDKGDLLSRFSADEFVLLIDRIDGPRDALNVSDAIIDSLRNPFVVQGETLHITISVGISLFPSDAKDHLEMIRHADSAMARAKESGRNTFMFYTPEFTSIAVEHFSLHNALIDALDRDEFHLVYQPQISLEDNRYIGMEALLRWDSRELGFVSPGRFIPVAESTGLIKPIGLWVLQTACAQAKAWLDQGFEFGRVSINVAGPQFMQANFTRQLLDTIEKTGVPPTSIELEVTESFLMNDIEEATLKLDMVRNLGITVALDDFGTGYSSLSYLRRLPVDKIKIDQSFVRELTENAGDQAIVKSIIALSSALNMKVIAEGVETEEHARFLRELGCLEGQGYLFSRPVKPEALWFNQDLGPIWHKS